MEQPLPRALEAEIVDADGRWMLVRLTAYLGESRWRATLDDGREIIVEASQIFTVARGQAA
jgi:hypothetical protein